MTPASIDELLEKLHDFAQECDRGYEVSYYGLPIRDSADGLRSIVAQWAAGQSIGTHHCNICGGEVDLSNATKPTEKVGRGPKFKQTDAPDDGDMKGKTP